MYIEAEPTFMYIQVGSRYTTELEKMERGGQERRREREREIEIDFQFLLILLVLVPKASCDCYHFL